jgi:ubiquinone/menaquinone biosynthesis C-methylase UbiE
VGDSVKWRKVWEENSKADVSDFELDRGISPRAQEIEVLSTAEHIAFVNPKPGETVLDAGCGTGVNILRLSSRVTNIVGIDFAAGSVERCQKRLQEQKIPNAQVCVASLTAIPLADHSVDKILCLSVLQYLRDDEVRMAFREFARVLADGGTLVLHVKNASSLYWSTLHVAKKLKALLGREGQNYYVRSFDWYVRELASFKCEIVEYKSFNVLSLERMPKGLLSRLQEFELRHPDGMLALPVIRRHGADLKIKAVISS